MRPNSFVWSPLALLGLLQFELAVQAQSQSFSWGFSALPSDGTSLPECSTLKVGVSTTQLGSNPVAQPPFSIIAYPSNGIPTVAGIGSDPSNLSWTVNYPSGTSLLLQVVDANGNSGGVDRPIFSVTAGSSSSCHGTLSSPISLEASTNSLNTCDPLVLDIAGGAPPYTVSVVAQNGLHAYNATLGDTDNRYTWYDVAIPTDSPVLLAAVSDANGQYGKTTSFISLGGSSDVSCPGKVSGGSQIPPDSGGGRTQSSDGGSNNSQPADTVSQSQPAGTGTGSGSDNSQQTAQSVSHTNTNGAQPTVSTDSSSSGSSTTTGTRQRAASSSSSTGANGGPQPAANTGSAASGDSGSDNKGIIIGAALGGLAALSILVLLLLLWRRRRRRNLSPYFEEGLSHPEKIAPSNPILVKQRPPQENRSPLNVNPFTDDHEGRGLASRSGPYMAGLSEGTSASRYSQNASTQPEEYHAGGFNPYLIAQGSNHPSSSKIRPSEPAASPTSPILASQSMAPAAADRRSDSEVVVHRDAGPAPREETEIPPAYGDFKS